MKKMQYSEPKQDNYDNMKHFAYHNNARNENYYDVFTNPE